MTQFILVVKPFQAEAVLQAISDRDVAACVVREAKGYRRQKGYLSRYGGSEYSTAFLSKAEITLRVSDDRAEEVADRVVRTARTGRMGGIKISLLRMHQADPIEF